MDTALLLLSLASIAGLVIPRAITMLNNSRDKMKADLSKVSGGLISLQLNARLLTKDLQISGQLI